MRPGSTALICLILGLTGCGPAAPAGAYLGPQDRALALCPPDMVLVPGGGFLAGGTPDQVGLPDFVPDVPRDPRPRGLHETAAFCIDRLEWPGAGLPSEANVTWLQARVACEGRGRRLCSEDEWSKACGGPLGWMRPYGDTHVAGLCHADVQGEGRYDEVKPSGQQAGCVSVYGVMDLEGNLSEWGEASLEPPDPATIMQNRSERDDAPVRERRDFRAVHGGTMWPGVYGAGCQARHGHAMVSPVSGDDGFRCCRPVGG